MIKVIMTSDAYGAEEFDYETMQEALNGLARLRASAKDHQKRDDIVRSFDIEDEGAPLVGHYTCGGCAHTFEEAAASEEPDAEENGTECQNPACESAMRVWPDSVERRAEEAEFICANCTISEREGKGHESAECEECELCVNCCPHREEE